MTEYKQNIIEPVLVAAAAAGVSRDLREEPRCTLIPSGIKPEAEVVADLKRRAGAAMADLCAVMDDAVRAGFSVRWAGISVGQMLRHEAVDLHLEKRY